MMYCQGYIVSVERKQNAPPAPPLCDIPTSLTALPPRWIPSLVELPPLNELPPLLDPL